MTELDRAFIVREIENINRVIELGYVPTEDAGTLGAIKGAYRNSGHLFQRPRVRQCVEASFELV